jgi:hypothetical protein
MIEGLAFAERCNDDREEGDDEKDPNASQPHLVALLPESLCHAFKKLGDCEFGSPDE